MQLAWRLWIRGQGLVLGALLAAIILVTLTNVMGRFVFGFSLPWSDEFSRLALIVLTFLGAALAVAYQAHIAIDAVPTLLARYSRVSTVLTWTLHAVSMLFFVLLFRGGWELATTNFDQDSPALRFSMGIVYLCIPVGAALMAVNYLGSVFLGARILPEVVDAQEVREGLEAAEEKGETV